MAEVAAALADPATAWVVRDVESKVRAVCCSNGSMDLCGR